MSPNEIKSTRMRLGLTQETLAEALGIASLSVSHYETGFRNPGPTALVFLMVIDSLPKKRALELIEIFGKAADRIRRDRKGSTT